VHELRRVYALDCVETCEPECDHFRRSQRGITRKICEVRARHPIHHDPRAPICEHTTVMTVWNSRSAYRTQRFCFASHARTSQIMARVRDLDHAIAIECPHRSEAAATNQRTNRFFPFECSCRGMLHLCTRATMKRTWLSGSQTSMAGGATRHCLDCNARVIVWSLKCSNSSSRRWSTPFW
jgi:hypothetical protein